MLKIDINLAFEIVNLLILFVAMRIFLFKPVNKIIAARQAEADKQFDEADSIKKEAAQLKDKYEETLANAEEEKKIVLAEARKNADKEYQRIIEDANKNARKINEEAKIQAENEKAEILKKAEFDIADMVVVAAGKIAGTNAGPKNDSKLYDKFISEVGDKT